MLKKTTMKPTDKQRENSGKKSNLKSWKKGQSGNPKGRPKKADCLTSLLKEEIEKVDPRDRHKRTYRELIVIATMRLAMKGNAAALREVWDRMDGKVKDEVEMKGSVDLVQRLLKGRERLAKHRNRENCRVRKGENRAQSGHSDV